MQLTQTVVSKSMRDGWQAETMANIHDKDYQIYTSKGSGGKLTCRSQKGTMDGGMFSFMMFGDETLVLASVSALCTEANVRELHEQGLAKFKELKFVEASTPEPYKVDIGQIIFTDGPGYTPHRRAVCEVIGKARYRTVLLDATDFHSDDHVRDYKDKFGIGSYYNQGDIISESAVNQLILDAEVVVKERSVMIQEAAYQAKADRWEKIAAGKQLVHTPTDAVCIIIAKHKVNESDPMTDYFAHSTDQTIYLAYSNHTKDLFAEFRKAALRSPITEHMATLPADCENRQKYSMGAGYYLGEHMHYGWEIRKTSLSSPYGETHDALYIAAAEGRYFCESDSKGSDPSHEQSKSQKNKFELIKYSDRAIAVFGDTKPVKDLLKELGGRFNKFLMHPKNGVRAAGWIFPVKQEDKIKQALQLS